MGLNKHLVYFYYIPEYQSDHWHIMFQLHMNCLNSYNCIFDKYTFILAFDNLDNYELIDLYQNEFIKQLNLIDKPYNFLIVQNNPLTREGIYFMEYVLNNLDYFENDMVLWGHGKTDQTANLDLVMKWVAISHFQLSYNINSIEQTFINDKDACTYGANLSIGLEQRGCLNLYIGSFYWLYPKRILELYREYIDTYNSLLYDFGVIKERIEHQELIRLLSEHWVSDILSYNNRKAMNKKIIVCASQIIESDGLFHGRLYISRGKKFNLPNAVYANSLMWEDNEIFSPEIFKQFYEYYNNVTKNIIRY